MSEAPRSGEFGVVPEPTTPDPGFTERVPVERRGLARVIDGCVTRLDRPTSRTGRCLSCGRVVPESEWVYVDSLCREFGHAVPSEVDELCGPISPLFGKAEDATDG